jgi:hypothetical protein
MRYRRGFIALSDERDVPMLLAIRNARAITCDQISTLLLNNGTEKCRRSVLWRLDRLEHHGFVERIDCGRLLPGPVFAITRSGLELLELRGHALLSLPSTTKDIVRRSQVLHSVELARICTALTAAHVLISWQWELEVLSQNLVYGSECTKDFDALVEVSDGDHIRSFAFEFERTAKGTARYGDLRKVLGAANGVDTILYLTPDPSILYLLAIELRSVNKRIGFALSRTFRSSLLSTNIITNTSANDVVTFREFLFG